MNDRKPPPSPSGPCPDPEDQLLRIVNKLDCPEEQRSLYLSFTRELCATLSSPPVPGLSGHTQQVVLKWFQQGLCGQLLWQIVEQIVFASVADTQKR